MTRGTGRFVLRLDDRHQYGLTFDGRAVEAFVAVGPVVHTVQRVSVGDGVEPTLRISAKLAPERPWGGSDESDVVELAVVLDDGTTHIMGEFDGRYLSTEVAGGFTGRVLGVEALSGSLDLRFINYTTTTPRHASRDS